MKKKLNKDSTPRKNKFTGQMLGNAGFVIIIFSDSWCIIVYCINTVQKVIYFLRYCTTRNVAGKDEILCGIFRVVSRFPLHFMLYLGNFYYCLYSKNITQKIKYLLFLNMNSCILQYLLIWCNQMTSHMWFFPAHRGLRFEYITGGGGGE